MKSLETAYVKKKFNKNTKDESGITYTTEIDETQNKFSNIVEDSMLKTMLEDIKNENKLETRLVIYLKIKKIRQKLQAKNTDKKKLLS